jgi:iron complex outermembrane recepter protein
LISAANSIRYTQISDSDHSKYWEIDFMVNQQLGNPLVRAAVRTVLTGGALAAGLGVVNAPQANAQQANAQTNSQTDTQQLVAQATVPAPAAASSSAASSTLQLQEVVVTGSRIAVPNQTSVSPVTFVNAQAFQQIGATRVEDVLNRLPQVFADQNSTSINGGNGTENVDLRGLGAQRTLVLIDGLRMSYGDPRIGGAAADLKMIPTALIENVQILTGGASSIYGADAVAGVVNFKLMEHFEGVKLIVNGGGYFHSNNNNQNVITDLENFNASTGNTFKEAPSSIATGAQKQVTFIAGMNSADNRGNATFFWSYRNIAKATQNLLSYSACSLNSGFLPHLSKGKTTGTGNFTCGGSLTSYPGSFLKINGGTTTSSNTVGPGGTLLPLSSEARFNFGPLNYMQAPDITWSAGAFMHYDLNSHATVYNTVMFMDDRTQLQIAPSGDFGNPVNVSCGNPYLSAAELNLWCGGSTAGNVNSGGIANGLIILRRDVEGPDRVADEEHTDWREVLGVKGSINDDWTYDASYQFSQVKLVDQSTGDFSVEKLNFATDVVNDPNPKSPTFGQPICAATAAGVTTGLAAGCVPWNIFGTGPVNPAAIAYLGTPALQRGEVTQHVIDLNFTGDMSRYVQLPTAHGGLQLAVGSEYKDISADTLPDAEFQSGDLAGSGGATLPVAGTIVSWDQYVEARLPLIDDKPFAKSVAMDDSYRHSHYSIGKGFDTNTFSLGLTWAPTDDVRLRGTFTRAVRAPNVTELYSIQNVALDGTDDPCAGPAPEFTAAQCANTGVPAGRYGSVSANPAAQYNGFTGGNPDLKPETAFTTSFGIGFTPHWVPNLRLQIDYFDIDIKNIIRSIGENTILNDCASQDLFCGLIHRDALDSLWLTTNGFVVDTLANVGNLREKGVDFDLSYAYDFGRFGRVNASMVGTYLDELVNTPVSALGSSAYDCAGFYGPTCSSIPAGSGGPDFKWRHDMTVTWETPFQPLSVTVGWRFLDSVQLESLSSNPNLKKPGSVAAGTISNTDAHLPSISYLDTSFGYHVTDNIQVRLGVNNLLDKDPPVVGASNLPSPPIGNGNTMPGTYDWGGRFVFGELSAQF